ncbi:hypothetical protein GGI12_005446 [Dipsacomyces acuminosporus]|nr:hypothetical protein GGI12_005446 [Dipsacomyces acuminosporus]
MNLALAIAEQYVLVAQDFPEINDNDSNGNDCDLDASTITHKSSSFWFSTYHHHSSTRAKHKRGGSGNSLFSRVWRPRTISNGSTVVCDSIDGTPLSSNKQGQMAAPPPALAASRERPVCC